MATVQHSHFHPGMPPPGIPSDDGQRENASASVRPAADYEKLRTEVIAALRSWSALEPGATNETFIRKLEIVSRQIARTADRLQKAVSSGATLSSGDSALLANLMVIRKALRDCRQVLRSKCPLPRVAQESWNSPAPRVYALSIIYLNSTRETFDELGFQHFAAAIQQESPLQMKELWNLKPYLEFALLERIAESIARLGNQGADPRFTSVNTKATGRLRRCSESLRRVVELDWKKLFEEIDETDKVLRTDPLGAYGQMDFETRDSYRSAVAIMAAHSGYSEWEIAREAIVLARQSYRSRNLSGRAKERRSHVGYYLVGPGQNALKQRIGYRPGILEKARDFATGWPDYFYFVSIELAALALILGTLLLLDARPPAVWELAFFFLVIIECALAVTHIFVTSLLPPKKLPKFDFSKAIPDDCATAVVVPTLLTSEAQVRQSVRDLEIRFLGNRDRNLHFALLTDPPDSKQQFDEKDALATLCSELIEQLNQTYGGKRNGSFFHFHRPRTFNPREGQWMGWERKRGKLLQFNRFLLGREDAFPVKAGNLPALSNVRYVITLDADTQLPPGVAHRLIGAIAHPLNRAVIDEGSNIVTEGYGILQPRVEISSRSARRSRLASLFSGETGLDVYTRAVSDVYQDLFGEAIFSGKGIYEVGAFQKALDGRLPCDAILSHDSIEGAHARAGLLSDVEVIDDYPSSFSSLNRRKHRWIRGDWQISPWLFCRVRDSLGRYVANPIGHVSRWKILDNLRRSVTDAAILALLLYAWFAEPQHAIRWTLVLLGILLLPIYVRLFTGIGNAGRNLFSRTFWKTSGKDLWDSHARLLLRLAFLCHQALLDLDAVVRTIVRMKITHRRMLQWETAAAAESSADKHPLDKYAPIGAAASVLIGVLLAAFHPWALAVASPFLILWAALPKIVAWLDSPPKTRQSSLNSGERSLIRGSGLRTWRFFREFGGAEENWLVPDLVQEAPPAIVHRVSTTNLGLLLNARLAAFDLGYLTPEEFAETTGKTFETIDRMPKFRGQLYNWYSTLTLEPVEPLFVSTVDNGNLLCSLWTLKGGCLEIPNQPICRPAIWQGILDHIDLLAEIAEGQTEFEELGSAIRDLQYKARLLFETEAGSLETLLTLEVDTAIFMEKLAECPAEDEIRWWAGELESRVKHAAAEIRDLAPWLLPDYGPVRDRLGVTTVPKLSELTLAGAPSAYAELEKAAGRLVAGTDIPDAARTAAARLLKELRRSQTIAAKLHAQLRLVAQKAQRLADDMDFSLFFDAKREMLSIGYDAGEGCISKWHYDLLPSEARSAAFGGIAQGSIPHKTWFRLGRFHGSHNREPLLYSWSGTMFEYLMPCLWTKSHPNSLLERSARAAIRVQRKFAEQKNIPWGVSECACNDFTRDGHYVYHAFGVPSLALHRDEYSNDVVIAPYATFLALMFDPIPAARNLERMKQLGWLGAYGFYDAADFTTRRIPSGKEHEIVRTWMAHHQGMTLVAISNALCDSAMQRRFHSDSRVAAAERMLHEKPPVVLPSWERDAVDTLNPDADSADAAKPAA